MKLKYRPEIDGLRAIAVGAVILYHAQITAWDYQLFKGGFIGVDIFFVISGYLITSIILKELVTTGSFSFQYFYERRVRRILPALLFVMLASLPFAWIYLIPGSFVDFSKSILYSLGFSANFYFHYSGQVYGATDGLLKPFLHIWTLSIEEQFYILFPITLFVIFKYFRKYLIHIFILGFVVSVALADWASTNHPSFNFYILPSRGWEFLTGSILAYFEITLGHRGKNKVLNLVLPILGLFLIGHSILYFNDEMFHPSFYTLSPIIGVCLIIWFSETNEIVTKLLSAKLFVGIGLISYSLYLWHYPIFAFAKINQFNQGTLFNNLSLVIITILLSIFSYYFIERPFRNKNQKFKVIISLILIIISVLVIFSFYVIHKDGLKDRMPQILNKDLHEVPWGLLKNLDGEECFGSMKECRFNTSSNKKVYIIGDSHMGSIMFDLKSKLVKENYQFITITSSCLYFIGFDLRNIKTEKITHNCSDKYFQKLKLILSEDKNSIIIFGGRYPLYLSNYYFDNQEGGIEGKEWDLKYVSVSSKYDNIQTSFKNEVLELSKNNKIILVYPIPEVGWHLPKKLLNLLNFETNNIQLIKEFLTENHLNTSFEVYKNRTKSSFELLDSIQGENINRVYPHMVFCNTTIDNRCETHDDKNIFYADEHHPSSKGAEMINDLIMKEIEKIELKLN